MPKGVSDLLRTQPGKALGDRSESLLLRHFAVSHQARLLVGEGSDNPLFSLVKPSLNQSSSRFTCEEPA